MTVQFCPRLKHSVPARPALQLKYGGLLVGIVLMKSINWRHSSYFLTVLQEHYPVDALIFSFY